MSLSQHKVTIRGEISWELLFDYDNSNNTGTIKDKVTVEVHKFINYRSHQDALHSTIRKELQSHKAAEEGGFFTCISAKVDDASNEINETVRQTTKTVSEASFREKHTYEREIVVGPKSKLALYQQRFTAPGINIMGSALSTNPPPKKSVTIEYMVEAIRFIKGIKVVYGSSPGEAPANRIREYNDGNDNINAGYGGKYTWLVPIYTYKVTEAATMIDLYIQPTAHRGWNDLAWGASGGGSTAYRYLVPSSDPHNQVKITELKLYRLDNALEGPCPAPYSKCTGDINAGRKRTYLYLMWSTRAAI